MSLEEERLATQNFHDDSCIGEGGSSEMKQKMDQVVDSPPKTLENRGNNLEYLKIRLSDIQLATNNFFRDYRISSWDNYTLYRAEVDHYDIEVKNDTKRRSTVIIKQYREGHDLFTEEVFFKEIEMLTTIKHRNIVTLFGFCAESSEMILVTENVSNGFLDSYLGNTQKMSILTWEKRLEICIDVAKALNYLHYEMKDQKMMIIINRDISSANIGFDENWTAKISDFAISKLLLPQDLDGKPLERTPIGSPFYIDPEYKKTGKLKRESDVYSFGVVLLEILCGRKVSDPIYGKSETGLASVARQNYLARTVEDMIDPIIKEEKCENNFILNSGSNKLSLQIFIKIAHQCVAETQDQRPNNTNSSQRT